LYKKLKEEEIEFYLGYGVEELENNELVGVKVNCKGKVSGEIITFSAERILIAAGRKPNFETLNLEKAGVHAGKKEIQVNAKCRTNVKNIFACGDVTGKPQFTHYAEHMAKTAITNMILKIPLRLEKTNIPWCTYTDPEIAQVGMNEQQLNDKNITFEVYKFRYNKIDRALADSTETGWIKGIGKKKFGTDLWREHCRRNGRRSYKRICIGN